MQQGKRRQGIRSGVRQRRSEDAAPLARPSALARFLIERFGFGLMTASLVQQVAMLASDDHQEPSPNELEEVASIGGRGSSLGNAFRDLMRMVTPKLILSGAMMKFRLPLLSLKQSNANKVHVENKQPRQNKLGSYNMCLADHIYRLNSAIWANSNPSNLTNQKFFLMLFKSTSTSVLVLVLVICCFVKLLGFGLAPFFYL